MRNELVVNPVGEVAEPGSSWRNVAEAEAYRFVPVMQGFPRRRAPLSGGRVVLNTLS